MLFSEQVRIIKDEDNPVNDTAVYEQSSVCDWTTKATKNITVDNPLLIFLKFDTILYESGAGISAGAGRLVLDGVPIISSGYIERTVAGTTVVTREMWLYLSAGSHTFNYQLSFIKKGLTADRLKLSNIIIYTLNFADKVNLFYDSDFISCPATTLTTLIDQNFTPPNRKLAIGSVKKYNLFLYIYAEREEQRVSKVKNAGEGNDANFFNWRLFINDVELSWTARADDCGPQLDNPTYGEGAYGYYNALLDAGTQYNLKIKCYNGFGSAYNGRVRVKAMLCPWIIPITEYEPITLDFPQGSTFYITTEPLTSDPSKTSKIGRKRFISFGDATDYYSKATGQGILNHNYTFEIVEVANSVLLVSGYGGCISIIGCDIR